MPAFVNTAEKEKDWQRAKQIVKEEYNLTEKSDKFWKLTNSIYHKINKEAKAKQDLWKMAGYTDINIIIKDINREGRDSANGVEGLRDAVMAMFPGYEPTNVHNLGEILSYEGRTPESPKDSHIWVFDIVDDADEVPPDGCYSYDDTTGAIE